MAFLDFETQVRFVKENRWGIHHFDDLKTDNPLWLGIFGYSWDQEQVESCPQLSEYKDFQDWAICHYSFMTNWDGDWYPEGCISPAPKIWREEGWGWGSCSKKRILPPLNHASWGHSIIWSPLDHIINQN